MVSLTVVKRVAKCSRDPTIGSSLFVFSHNYKRITQSILFQPFNFFIYSSHIQIRYSKNDGRTKNIWKNWSFLIANSSDGYRADEFPPLPCLSSLLAKLFNVGAWRLSSPLRIFTRSYRVSPRSVLNESDRSDGGRKRFNVAEREPFVRPHIGAFVSITTDISMCAWTSR